MIFHIDMYLMPPQPPNEGGSSTTSTDVTMHNTGPLTTSTITSAYTRGGAALSGTTAVAASMNNSLSNSYAHLPRLEKLIMEAIIQLKGPADGVHVGAIAARLPKNQAAAKEIA